MLETDRLRTLSRLAIELGSRALAAEAEALAERLREGRFYVASVGQFKRGKSTLLNALVGAPLLPAGVVPITAAVTVLRHGERVAARVRLGERDWEDCDPGALATYVSEEQNPGNEKEVRGVEVFAPSPLLERGLCLVDTPGLGSVSETNSATTRAFVPHVDAALVVLGADPPITGEELALIDDIVRDVQDLILVFNKADRTSDLERQEAIRFTERVLVERLGRPVGPLLRPIEETRARVAALRAAVAEAERSLEELGHRLTGVQERLSRTFTGERDRFFRLALPEAERELREQVRADGGADRGLRSRAMDHARDVARRWLERWRTEHAPRAEALYQEAVTRFVELLDEFRARLMQVGVGVPGVAAETGFRSRSRFHFTEMLAVAPARRPVLDVIGPRRHRLRRAERQAAAYLERLLEVNSARVKNDFRDRVEESRRLLEQEIRGGLAEIAASAQRALAAASSAHAAGGAAVEARLAWLRRLRSRVESPSRVEV